MATNAEIKVTADTSQAIKSLGDLDRALGNLRSSTADVTKAFAAVTAASGAIAYAVMSTLDSAGQLIDAAAAIGISAQSLQVFQGAAALSGIEAEQLNATLMKLNVSIGDALVKGSGSAYSALERLGIPINQIAGMKADAQFELIAAKLMQIESPALRAAAAVDFFGKQGPKMLALAENLEGVRKKLQAMGLELSDFDLAALDMAGDKVDELKGIFDKGLKKAVADISPYVVAIADKIQQAIIDAGGFEKVWGNIKTAIKEVYNVLLITTALLTARVLATGAIALVAAMRSASVAAALFNAIVMRNPLMLAVGAALLLAKVLGIDVGGAVNDYLFGTLDIAASTDKINDKAEVLKKTNEANVEVMKGFNEEQQKAITALDETIAKIKIQAGYQGNILRLGEDEANIVKLVAEERAKLLKAHVTMTAEQEKNVRSAQDLLNINTKLVKGQERLKELATGARVAAGESPEVLKAQKEMEDAYKVYQTALANGDRAAASSAQNQATQFLMAYRSSVIAYATSLSEKSKLDTDYNLKVAQNAQARLSLEQNGFNTEHELYRNLMLERYKIDQEYAAKKSQLELQNIEIWLNSQRDAVAKSLAIEDQRVLQAAGASDRQKQITADRMAFEKKSDLEKTAFAIDQGAQMFTALGAHNKKAFEAAKAFNIANAIMNTYMAATKALASLPPPFSFIAAGAAIGMGLAQVAQIRSQQYSGRALGGPVMANETYMVGENGPELFTPNTTGSITRNQDLQNGSSPTVNFNIQAVDASSFDQLLASRRGMITQIIGDAMAEKGQRSNM